MKRICDFFVEDDPNWLLKLGIWTYFFLLIFEGALRKWFLPGLATPLLVVRDPLALMLIYYTWKRNLIPSSFYLTGMIAVGIFGLISALLFGHGNLAVGLFGARIFLIQFPLIFIIGSVFEKKDVLKIGKIMLLLSVPMAILISLQFYSPQSSLVNRGVGGDIEGAGFSGAMGYFRPSGTFSFTNGNTMFFSLLACFVFYFWLSASTYVNRFLLISATIALFVAVPLSISRSLLFQVVIVVVFALCAGLKYRKYANRIIGAGILSVLILILLNNTGFFQTSTEVFTSRFESASDYEGGIRGTLVDRYLGNLIGAVDGSKAERLPFFGYGMGMGSNVGSMLLSGGRAFLIAEEEWARLIGEMGYLMGLFVIFMRLGICFEMAIASYRKLAVGDLLPWMLLGFCLLIVPQGQWAQPTALGFSIFIGGILLASLNEGKDIENHSV